MFLKDELCGCFIDGLPERELFLLEQIRCKRYRWNFFHTSGNEVFFIKLKTQESSQNIRLGMKQQLHLSIFWDLHHLKITSSVMTSLHT